MCLHSCDIPLCVNPSHLREGTNDDNMANRHIRNRTAKGSRMAAAKLTEQQAREIKQRALAGENTKLLTKEFNIVASGIHRIRRGLSWKHVE